MESDNELLLRSRVAESERLRPSIDTGIGFVKLTGVS